MCSVNVAEVAKFLMDNKGYSKDQAKEVIEHIIDEIVDFSTEQAFVTAELYSQTKKAGLSLGDRACLGLSMSTRYSVYTADKAWTSLALSINIKCIR
jgi:PIN domain nuclease of toxin-antitoxin system